MRMSRPSRCFLLLLVVAVTLTGCKTIYSDMYSNRRNRFVPPPPKPTKIDEPITPLDAAPGNLAPAPDALGLPPPAMGEAALPADPGAGAAPMAPAIPGL